MGDFRWQQALGNYLLSLAPIPVNEIDRNPEILILQGIQVFGSNGNF